MTVKERILAIRLMEKVSANPAHAEALGIVVSDPAEQIRQYHGNKKDGSV